MKYNQIFVIHSRGVYNFMGIILERQVSFILSVLCIIFKNYVQILVIFFTYVLEKMAIKIELHANVCVRWIEAFIANLGNPLCAWQSIQEWAAGVFYLSSLEMLIPAFTARPIKDDPDLQWMPLVISHTNVHAILSLWQFFLTRKWRKSPKSKPNFWKECIKATKWKTHVAPKLYP